MGNWLWVLTGILLCIIFILLFKLFMLKKTAEEIQSQFAEKLKTETNTLISISHSDKTMRKLAEDINVQLRKLREERQRFQRGDTELKTAVTNISHDLRTPLTAICGYMELMENEEKSESVSRYLERIGERIEMLKSLTEELFKYSIAAQMEEMQKEHVDLGRLLEESLVSFYGAIKQNNIEMEVSLAGEKVETRPPVPSDGSKRPPRPRAPRPPAFCIPPPCAHKFPQISHFRPFHRNLLRAEHRLESEDKLLPLTPHGDRLNTG